MYQNRRWPEPLNLASLAQPLPISSLQLWFGRSLERFRQVLNQAPDPTSMHELDDPLQTNTLLLLVACVIKQDRTISNDRVLPMTCVGSAAPLEHQYTPLSFD